MKAMRLEATGQLFTREVEKPEAGPDDLLVRVEACGVCGTDRHLYHGEFPCTPPVTLGHEFSGIVEAVGSAVTGFKLGDRITGDPNIACGRCRHCVNGQVNLCRNLKAIGIHRDGGFADYVVVPHKQAFLLPADLDPMHGAFCEPLACCLHGIDLAEIKAGSSMKDITALLESGKSILYSVSFPEGLTVKQMFQRLAADTVLEGDLPTELPPEGSLRPDTYKFTRGTNRAEIVAQMRAAQERLIDQIWEKRDPDLPVTTKEEFVTLASIVEKETGKDDERAHVASVFINRLNKGMRLQSDPTIIYGLFGGDGKPADRPIFQSDIRKETPYNTYVIRGLPPGPIANPGRAALEAVAHPWKTDDLYFVADGTGGHAFAKTLDEHNANVRRWRKIEAERAQTPPATLDVEPEVDPSANN